MMTMIDDIKNPALPPKSGTDRGADPWADWKPAWTRAKAPASGRSAPASGKTVQDHQEKHSPTTAVATHLGAGRKQVQNRRRIVDARLWDAMSAAEQDAALQIAFAFETMGRGLGYAASDWQRVPGMSGSGNLGEMHARLVGFYVEWTKRCHPVKISHALIIDVLVFGFTCRALDRDRRVRAGTARGNLLNGLKLYCEMRGWK